MRPHAVYIIAEDGRNAFSKRFSTIAPDEDLVSAMIVAMQNFIKEVTGTYFSELTAGPIQFSAERAGPFYVVLVSTRSTKAIEKVKHLGILFMRRYKTLIENWKGETIDFEGFNEDIDEVIGHDPQDLRIDPRNPLDAKTLIFLEPELQDIAKYLLRKKETTIGNIASDLNLDTESVLRVVETLFERGHVGKEKIGGTTKYFVV